MRESEARAVADDGCSEREGEMGGCWAIIAGSGRMAQHAVVLAGGGRVVEL